MIIRIKRPRMRRAFTVLNDCDPALTCMTASVRPWVDRTPLFSSGRQSIYDLKIPVMVPCRSGLR